jgi:uncharacterized coiled-coil DUF342 family protein
LEKANKDNDALRAHNDDLMSDLTEVQEMIGIFKNSSATHTVLQEKIVELEKINQSLTAAVELKDQVLQTMGTRVDDLEVRSNDNKESEKYKTAISAQKRYIESLTSAMKISDDSRDKLKEEVVALKDHRDKMADQIKAYEALRTAETTQGTANKGLVI